MALTPEDYQLMEDFIKGRLKGPPLQAFFDRLKNDAEFNAKYHQHREKFFAERFNKPHVKTTEEVDREEEAPAQEEVPVSPASPVHKEIKEKKIKPTTSTALQGGMVWLLIGLSLVFVGLSLFLLLDRVIFDQQVKEITRDRDSSRIRKIKEMLADTLPSSVQQQTVITPYKVTVDTLEVADAAKLRDTLLEVDGADTPVKVEFWKDPIRFKGYIYNKGTLRLYGVDEALELTLHMEGDSLLLDMDEEVYFLRSGSRYQQFRPIQRQEN